MLSDSNRLVQAKDCRSAFRTGRKKEIGRDTITRFRLIVDFAPRQSTDLGFFDRLYIERDAFRFARQRSHHGLHVGQDVRLVFPAFSSRTTPELFGSVAVVSADALTQENTGQTFYRAEIVLKPEELAKLSGLTLLPGMPVEAFIQSGERTPMAYLLKPFTDYFARAFRET